MQNTDIRRTWGIFYARKILLNYLPRFKATTYYTALQKQFSRSKAFCTKIAKIGDHKIEQFF
jgi:hypothetical protein